MNQEEAKAFFLPLIEKDGCLFEKFQKIWARPAVVDEKIVTYTSDGKETENTAKEGDYVIMAQTTAQEQYILSGEKLLKRYKEGKYRVAHDDEELTWQEYTPTGTVRALEFHPCQLNLSDPFYFEASWGENMIIKKGDMICTPDGSEVYRIARREFEQTYKIK